MASSSNPNPYARLPEHSGSEPAPPINVRYFYTSPLAIDDPLSPLPPPVTGSNAVLKQAPRPFLAFDNTALERQWLQIRKKLARQAEAARAERQQPSRPGTATSPTSATQLATALTALRKPANTETKQSYGGSESPISSPQVGPRRIPLSNASQRRSVEYSRSGEASASSSFRATELLDANFPPAESSSITRNPFIRAPSRSEAKSVDLQGTSSKSSTSARPNARPLDSYNWGEDTFGVERPQSRSESRARENVLTPKAAERPTAKVPVGVSRLHSVVFPEFQMEPIYWSPVKDIAPVQRATWFYAENMMPVETEVANMLELGYIAMQAWTETWKDELNSAIEVGAAGEEKIVHPLWPTKPKGPSRPSTSRGVEAMHAGSAFESPKDEVEKERIETATVIANLIDAAPGFGGSDNKASGSSPWGRDGTVRQYKSAGVIYANERNAYILRPSLLPSRYYGRRPLANYVRKNKSIGIAVVRGFDQQKWDKLYPARKGPRAKQAREGVSSAEAGIDPEQRQMIDPALADSERPEVTDLVLVIHGIGQKLSERVETYHFTHAINTFRREVNVELGNPTVKLNLRKDMGGIMVLPVNWRLTLSFEDGGYRDDNATHIDYSLKDITPQTLPSVRGVVSDVMLDIPYYLTTGYHDKMVTAVVREANRIYRLWCQNNPGFEGRGRVHLIAHSLGSVMAIDILSNQPTHVQSDKAVGKMSMEEMPKLHFAFDVSNLFLAGSPAGVFLLLKNSGLLPRRGREKLGSEDYGDDSTAGVAGEAGTYGCLAIDNVYNIVNGYDPVAYCLNATVDADYAAALKQAAVPSSSSSWLSFPSFNMTGLSSGAASSAKPPNTNRLPSNVELETHNFTREEIAERRAYLLNDNGQIDYFLKYGGGPLEIQYLTILSAHSSYWLSRDFVRMVVQETGRPAGRDGTLMSMRAVKKKKL